MSFSSQVKDELVKIEQENACCKKSLLYGMALFSKSFSFSSVVFQSKSKETAELFLSLLEEICSVRAKMSASPSGKLYTVSVRKSVNASRIMSCFGHERGETSLRINFSNFTCEDCQKLLSEVYSLPAEPFPLLKKIIIWSSACRILTFQKVL